jgi:hypothetical protein
VLIEQIIAGEAVHDNQRDLAASLLGSGLSEKATVEVLQGLLLASKMARDARWNERWQQISHDVHSAQEKFRSKSQNGGAPVSNPMRKDWRFHTTRPT